MEGNLVFAKRLREARELLGISQKQLGIRIGIDPFVASARLNQYERGKHVPDLRTAQKLAGALGMPVSFLYEPDDDLACIIGLLAKLPREQYAAFKDALQTDKTSVSPPVQQESVE